MRLKLALLMGLMFSAPQASLNQISDNESGVNPSSSTQHEGVIDPFAPSDDESVESAEDFFAPEEDYLAPSDNESVESAEDFFAPEEDYFAPSAEVSALAKARSSNEEKVEENLDFKKSSGNQQSTPQGVSHNSTGSVTAGMTDDERLEAAIEASSKLDQFTKAFQAEQAKVAGSPKSPLGKVAFEAVICDANNVKNSKDPAEIKEAINKVKAIQRSNTLTEDLHERVDAMLVDLVCALSVITNHETLGAR